MNVGKVISTSVKDGFRFVKMLIFGRDDVQDVHEVSPYGTDANPIKDITAIYAKTGSRGETICIGYVNKNRLSDVGEHRIFSTDSDGEVQMFLHLKNDGTAEFGGDADFMVRYNELETAFDELKSDFNDLVNSYNSHIHTTTATVGTGPVGVIAPTTSTGSKSTADITPAKIEEIKTL